MKPRLLIFDADDTLRRTITARKWCPDGPGEWELLPRVRDVLSAISWDRDDYSIGIASNQGGVASGHLTRENAARLLVDMVVSAIGYLPRKSYIELCTCDPLANCQCRKPAPGMLLRILEQSGVPADQALFVGDCEVDMEAAKRAGVHFSWAEDFFA
jgi:D-glycero-D-manno-heptose 1,7-bisphosphate phosphatase